MGKFVRELQKRVPSNLLHVKLYFNGLLKITMIDNLHDKHDYLRKQNRYRDGETDNTWVHMIH
jgi:hypothetical protein